jgi:hypothetical protein
MNRPILLYWSFIIGLIGGILILLGSVLMTFMMSFMGGMMVMMPDVQMEAMGGGFMGMGSWMLVVGALTSTVILIGATQVRDGKGPIGWGVAMVIAGVLSYLVMGGLLVGGLAAVAAGVLALVASSPQSGTPGGTAPHA